MFTKEFDEKLTTISLRDQIYQRLRQRILSHYYPPSHRFDLADLQDRLGVSRTPLKEALHRLELEGLVKIRPRSGTFVTPLEPGNIAESFDVRIMLETAAAPHVITNATDHEIAQLGVMNTHMRTLLENNAYQDVVQQFIDMDQELHTQYMSYTRNKQLMRIYSRLNTHLQIARVRRNFERAASDETQAEHDTILAALTARDVVALQLALTNHLEKSKQRTLSALTDHE